jgi:hypothetical protein
MDMAEYLRTSPDGSGCEYLDGEIVEPNLVGIPHGDFRMTVASILRRFRSRPPFDLNA